MLLLVENKLSVPGAVDGAAHTGGAVVVKLSVKGNAVLYNGPPVQALFIEKTYT